jgi:prolyl 4-hydroxylase
MKHTGEFVMAIQDALPKDVCQRLISKFEEHADEDIVTRDTDYYKFKELEITDLKEFESEKGILVHSASGLLAHYKKELNVNYFPDNYVLEGLRIKKYDPENEDEFDWHVDVGDASSCKRFMVVFWYLNTVEEGGYTAFDWDNDDEDCVIVEPKEGTALMFPPMWMYPHKGMAPKSGPKYIVSTYAHYVEN